MTRRIFPATFRLFGYRPLRASILEHLDFAYGEEMSRDEKIRIAKSIARNLGLTLAEVLASSREKLPAGYIDETEAVEKTHAALGECGFVGVTGHIGNWELLGSRLSLGFGERVNAVIVKRVGNPGINDLIEDIRRQLGMETFYQNESPMRLIRSLRKGGIVGTVPDQDVARLAGHFVDFFGHPAYTPTGPAMLAVHGKVPIVVAFMRRTKTGLRLIAYDPIWPDDTLDKADDIKRITEAWSEQIEHAIREQPEDWMWFHKRWETTPERLEARRAKRLSETA